MKPCPRVRISEQGIGHQMRVSVGPHASDIPHRTHVLASLNPRFYNTTVWCGRHCLPRPTDCCLVSDKTLTATLSGGVPCVAAQVPGHMHEGYAYQTGGRYESRKSAQLVCRTRTQIPCHPVIMLDLTTFLRGDLDLVRPVSRWWTATEGGACCWGVP